MSSELLCDKCEHPSPDHKGGDGICLSEGCMCNLFLLTPEDRPVVEVEDDDTDGDTPDTKIPMRGDPSLADEPRDFRTSHQVGPTVHIKANDVPDEKFVGSFIPVEKSTANRTLCCGEDVSGLAPNELHVCPVDLVPKEFIIALGRVFRDGLKDGRKADDWKELSKDDALSKVHNMYVHTGAEEYDSAACNSLILWWHFQREDPADKLDPGNGG